MSNYNLPIPLSCLKEITILYSHILSPSSVTDGIKVKLPPAEEIAIPPPQGDKPDVPNTGPPGRPLPLPKLDWVVNPSPLTTNTSYTKFIVTATNNSTDSEYFGYLQFNLTSGSAGPSLFTSDKLTAKHTVSNVAIEIKDVQPNIFVQDKASKVVWWRVVLYPKEGNDYITIPVGQSVSLEFSDVKTGVVVKDHIVEHYESWVDPDDLENPPMPSNSMTHTLAVKVTTP